MREREREKERERERERERDLACDVLTLYYTAMSALLMTSLFWAQNGSTHGRVLAVTFKQRVFTGR